MIYARYSVYCVQSLPPHRPYECTIFFAVQHFPLHDFIRYHKKRGGNIEAILLLQVSLVRPNRLLGAGFFWFDSFFWISLYPASFAVLCRACVFLKKQISFKPYWVHILRVQFCYGSFWNCYKLYRCFWNVFYRNPDSYTVEITSWHTSVQMPFFLEKKKMRPRWFHQNITHCRMCLGILLWSDKNNLKLFGHSSTKMYENNRHVGHSELSPTTTFDQSTSIFCPSQWNWPMGPGRWSLKRS